MLAPGAGGNCCSTHSRKACLTGVNSGPASRASSMPWEWRIFSSWVASDERSGVVAPTGDAIKPAAMAAKTMSKRMDSPWVVSVPIIYKAGGGGRLAMKGAGQLADRVVVRYGGYPGDAA